MLRLTLIALMTPMFLVGCGVTASLHGVDISDHDGRLFVAGNPVDFHREVSLQGEMDEANLRLVLVSPTAVVDVVGGPGNSYELVLDLYTEYENDGLVELQDGQLMTWSDMDGAVLVNGIRGRLPENISLDVMTATGDVLVTSFVGAVDVTVETGTGSVQVADCNVGVLRVDTGTGEVRVNETVAEDVKVEMGTGSLTVRASDFVLFHGDSATGNFLFQTSRLDRAAFVSGLGDVRLTDTLVSHMDSALGTGRVEVRETETKANDKSGN